jgi:hypothetical protein
MHLAKSYKNYLLLDHNRQYYHYNTFFFRFIKSKVYFKEIPIVFFNDALILLTLVFNIKYFYNLDLYFLLWTHISIYLLLSAKLLFIRLRYKGFYKPIFKCLECGKLTEIRLDKCKHCHSKIHKNQDEYKEKRRNVIIKKKFKKIERLVEQYKRWS